MLATLDGGFRVGGGYFEVERSAELQSCLRLLNEVHQASRHVVRTRKPVVDLAVFAKAQKNRVDRHLVDREEAVTDDD